jgi:hypothetical protein
MKSTRRLTFVAILLPLLMGAAMVGVFVTSYRFTTHNRGEERFLVYWAGMRTWLLDGNSPYSDAAASYVQELSVHSGDTQARVTYPLYGGFFFLPFAAIPSYTLARALWMTTLSIALLVTALLCQRLTGWRTSVGLYALFLLLSVTSYPGLSMLISGNATILAALFLIAALDALRLERDAYAGALLGLSTLQPLAVAVVLPFILLWSISRRRWLVVTWFFGLLAVLSVIGVFFIPDWIVLWLRNLLHYSDYLAPASPGAAFQNWWPGVGRQAGLLFTLILVISLFSEWWVARGRDFRWFLWTTGVTLIVAQWVGIPAGVENFIALLLPMTTIVVVMEERGGKRTRWVIGFLLLFLYTGTWGLYFGASEGQLRAAMLFLPPLELLLLLYWVRLWAIRPKRLLVEELKLHGEP